MASNKHPSLTLEPIGVVHSPFVERQQAPRQPVAAAEVRGRIELFGGRGFEQALSDVERWSHLWVLFWFHLNSGWRPMVRPPRGDRRRGVFSTRSPHRPNPLGLSVVKFEGRNGLILHVSGIDILDGSPVFDLKPYVAYTDALVETENGWLQAAPDPIAPFEVVLSERVCAQLSFLAEQGRTLEEALRRILKLGPEQPHYRRIKRLARGYLLAVKEWRAVFVAEGQLVTVVEIRSGYRASELAENLDPALDIHRAFVAFNAAQSPEVLIT